MCIRDRCMYACMWKIAFGFDLQCSFYTTSLKLDRTIVNKKLTLYSFWIRSAQWGRSLGSRKFKNFWKMKTWLLILLKLNKLIIWYENRVFEILDLIGGFGRELRASQEPKSFSTEFSQRFQRSLHWISMRHGTRWDHDECSNINFLGPFSGSEGDRDEKRPQKAILSEFKETECRKFLSNSG